MRSIALAAVALTGVTALQLPIIGSVAESALMQRVCTGLCGGVVAAAIALSPASAADVSTALLLNEFGDRKLVEAGLKEAGVTAKDARMIKLWATLKEARLAEAGAEAADQVVESAQELAAAQTQVCHQLRAALPSQGHAAFTYQRSEWSVVPARMKGLPS